MPSTGKRGKQRCLALRSRRGAAVGLIPSFRFHPPVSIWRTWHIVCFAGFSGPTNAHDLHFIPHVPCRMRIRRPVCRHPERPPLYGGPQEGGIKPNQTESNRRRRMNPTCNGKIARLPLEIRELLNKRLQDVEQGNKLVAWLDSPPEMRAVVASEFGGRPINEQSSRHWKQCGYRDWLVYYGTRAGAMSQAAVSPVAGFPDCAGGNQTRPFFRPPVRPAALPTAFSRKSNSRQLE